MDKGGVDLQEVNSERYNCNMCVKAKMCLPIGNVCFGEKFRGKVIKYDDTICNEFEFGGFIELSESIQKIPTRVI